MPPEHDKDIPEVWRGNQMFILFKADHPEGTFFGAIDGKIGECGEPEAVASGLSRQFNMPVSIVLVIRGISDQAALALYPQVEGIHSVLGLTRSNFMKVLVKESQ